MGAILLKAATFAVIILLGYGLKRAGIFSEQDARVVSRIILNLTLPAALIASFRSFQIHREDLVLILIASVCNGFLLLLGLVLTRGRDVQTRVLYCLNLSSYNIGTFVLPFVQSFLAPEAILGVSMFDAGNCPWNSGIAYGIASSESSGSGIDLQAVWNRLRTSVPFLTYLLMMLLSVAHFRLPDTVFEIAGTIGGANSFLAMLMIGILLTIQISREDRAQIEWILLLRYGCNVLFCVTVWLLPLPLRIRQISVLSLLAPIPSVSLAYCERSGCKPALCGALNSLSIVISLLMMFLMLLIWKV